MRHESVKTVRRGRKVIPDGDVASVPERAGLDPHSFPVVLDKTVCLGHLRVEPPVQISNEGHRGRLGKVSRGVAGVDPALDVNVRGRMSRGRVLCPSIRFE
jgi:hypothetical protein